MPSTKKCKRAFKQVSSNWSLTYLNDYNWSLPPAIISLISSKKFNISRVPLLEEMID